MSEGIPSSYIATPLIGELEDFYKLLFPAKASRSHKKFLVHNYLRLIDAAGLTQAIKAVDSRLTYNLDSEQYFKIFRTSNPHTNAVGVEMTVRGDYVNNPENADLYDRIRVQQVLETNPTLRPVDFSNPSSGGSFLPGLPIVNMFSWNNARNYGQTILKFSSPYADVGLSSPVWVGNTGLTIQFNATVDFQITGDKYWDFIAEAPYEFNFQAFYDKLKQHSHIVDRMLRLPVKVGDESFSNLWRSHWNPVYQVAGLLVAYVNKIA